MRFINKNDPITVSTKDKTYEGYFEKQQDKCIWLKEDGKTKAVPFNLIESLDTDRDLPVSSIQEMMKYYKGILNERTGVHDGYGYGLLPRGSQSISIEASPYELYRLLLKMPDPSMYTTPDSSFGYTDSLMTFHNPIEYEKVKEYLKQYGYKYTEIGGNDTNTEEGHEENTTSPYPKNVHGD